MNEHKQIRSDFFRGFVKELIKNSKPKVMTHEMPEIKKEIMSRSILQKIKQNIQIEKPKNQPWKNTENLILQNMLIGRKREPIVRPNVIEFEEKRKIFQAMQNPRPIAQQMPPQKVKNFQNAIPRPSVQFNPQQANPKSQPMKPQVNTLQKINISSLTKIEPLILDPSVQTIECPGPDKPLLIYKSGVIQTTKILLSTDEINNIMKEISERTRIPIEVGVFKAALEDFIITSVMSEFVGTRFIIQKKPRLPAA